MTTFQTYRPYHDSTWCHIIGKQGVKLTAKDKQPGVKKLCPECGRYIALRHVAGNTLGFPKHKQVQPARPRPTGISPRYNLTIGYRND